MLPVINREPPWRKLKNEALLVISDLQQRLESQRDGRLARGHSQRPDTAFQLREARLEHRLSGVRDARVNVARHFQVEELGAMFGGIKDVARRLVNWHGEGTPRQSAARYRIEGARMEREAIFIVASSSSGPFKACL